MDGYFEQDIDVIDREEYHAWLDHQLQHEQRPWPVMCDLCSAEDLAPEKALRAKGWELGRGYEFCPNH